MDDQPLAPTTVTVQVEVTLTQHGGQPHTGQTLADLWVGDLTEQLYRFSYDMEHVSFSGEVTDSRVLPQVNQQPDERPTRRVRVVMLDPDGNRHHATATQAPGQSCVACARRNPLEVVPDDPRASTVHVCLGCLVDDPTIESINIR